MCLHISGIYYRGILSLFPGCWAVCMIGQSLYSNSLHSGTASDSLQGLLLLIILPTHNNSERIRVISFWFVFGISKVFLNWTEFEHKTCQQHVLCSLQQRYWTLSRKFPTLERESKILDLFFSNMSRNRMSPKQEPPLEKFNHCFSLLEYKLLVQRQLKKPCRFILRLQIGLLCASHMERTTMTWLTVTDYMKSFVNNHPHQKSEILA